MQKKFKGNDFESGFFLSGFIARREVWTRTGWTVGLLGRVVLGNWAKKLPNFTMFSVKTRGISGKLHNMGEYTCYRVYGRSAW